MAIKTDRDLQFILDEFDPTIFGPETAPPIDKGQDVLIVGTDYSDMAAEVARLAERSNEPILMPLDNVHSELTMSEPYLDLPDFQIKPALTDKQREKKQRRDEIKCEELTIRCHKTRQRNKQARKSRKKNRRK